ncbi:hypothetical protein [Ruminococcus albus]|uniref:hypothetical protein n=1 Tax=Ruminococcus albus TaxID=1264 RepID=UPI000465355B|nr:hypothetical protein [Ruminococcus albus]
MARKDEKGQRFEFLVGRIDDAIKNEYYVEAMAITYALMEERSYTLLDRLNIHYTGKDKLYHCIDKLKNAINDKKITVTPKKGTTDTLIDFLATEFISTNLLDNIQNWRDRRNDVIHDLAKQTIDYDTLKQPSEDGRKNFALYSAVIMKVKKML